MLLEYDLPVAKKVFLKDLIGGVLSLEQGSEPASKLFRVWREIYFLACMHE
jgi:hypothetical protein